MLPLALLAALLTAIAWPGPAAAAAGDTLAIVGAAGPAATRSTPTLLLVGREAGTRSLTAHWHADSAAGLAGDVQVQQGGGAWLAVRPFTLDASGDFSFTRWPLRLGTITNLRLAWVVAGDTLTSDVAADTVAAAQAHAVFDPHTDRLAGTWTVAPTDSGLVWRLQRRLAAGGPDTTLVTASSVSGPGFAFSGVFSYDDHTVLQGTAYEYRVVASDGVGADTLASEPASTLVAPALFGKHVNPQQVDFDFYAPDAGTYNLALMRESVGGESAEAGLGTDANGHAQYTVYFTQSDAPLIYRLRWIESDNVVRYGRLDTTIVAQAQVDTLGALFGTYHVVTHWNIQPVDSTFFVTLERSDYGRGYTFIAQYHTRAGARFTYDDRTAGPSTTYDYRLSWGLGKSTVYHGFTHQAPRLGSARGRPDRITASWSTTGLPGDFSGGIGPRGFTGTLERRVPAGDWAALATISSLQQSPFTGVDSLGYDDFTAVLGQMYEYRVTWIDLGDTVHTAGVSATIPAVSATLYTVASGPTGVTIHWQVTGDDGLFPMRVLRRETVSSVWDTLGLSQEAFPGMRVYVDHQAVPGHQYSYELEWQQAGVTHVSAEQQTLAIGTAIQMGRPSPNPSRGGFSVPIGIPDAVVTQLTLYDIGGRVRFARPYQGPGVFTFTFPPGQLDAGVYFLRLEDGRRDMTRRIVVAP